MVKARGQANALPPQGAWLVFFFFHKSSWPRLTRVFLFRVFCFHRWIRADASNPDTETIAGIWGWLGIPLRTIALQTLLTGSLPPPQCPELHNRRPTTMTYFLRVAMTHQWAVILSSWTFLKYLLASDSAINYHNIIQLIMRLNSFRSHNAS